MADLADIALNIGGWIVAGLVTLVGVLAAHRIEERSRTRREDFLDVIEPMRREMESALGESYLIDRGGQLWTQSGAFRDLLDRGALRPKRHDDLRLDIDELLRRHVLHGESRSRFYTVRDETIKSLWAKTEAKDEHGTILPFPKIFGVGYYDDDLMMALAADSRERWGERCRILFRAREETLHVTLSVPWTPDEMFEEVRALVRAARDEYRGDAQAFLDQTEGLRSRLDLAIREGKLYRRAG